MNEEKIKKIYNEIKNQNITSLLDVERFIEYLLKNDFNFKDDDIKEEIIFKNIFEILWDYLNSDDPFSDDEKDIIKDITYNKTNLEKIENIYKKYITDHNYNSVLKQLIMDFIQENVF